MIELDLQLASTEALIDELRNRVESFALVTAIRGKDSDQSIATYYHHGGFFAGYGLAVAMVDWFKDERRPLTDEEVDELDDL